MAIPDYESIMLPLLKFANDGKEHRTREATEFISKEFSLSEKEEKKLLPSGNIRVIVNRVGWAATYLKKCLNSGDTILNSSRCLRYKTHDKRYFIQIHNYFAIS